MDCAFDRFTAEIRTALIEQGRLPTEQVELVTPKPGIAADLAFPTFRLARERGAPAPHVAQRLADTLRFAVGCGNVIQHHRGQEQPPALLCQAPQTGAPPSLPHPL